MVKLAPKGSIYRRKDGRWVAAVMFNGKRTYAYAANERGAQRALLHLRHALPLPYQGTRGVPPKPSFRPVAREWTARIIAIARTDGWSDEDTAAAIVAALAPKRLKYNIFGPCAYCGTWAANTVDHVQPVTRGGTDDPSNLVSCCYTCNHDKKDRTPDEWRAGVSVADARRKAA